MGGESMMHAIKSLKENRALLKRRKIQGTQRCACRKSKDRYRAQIQTSKPFGVAAH